MTITLSTTTTTTTCTAFTLSPQPSFSTRLSSFPQYPDHLPDDEQRLLLGHVNELRRIQGIEADLRRSQTSITSLHLSRASGYADEVFEMQDAIEHGEASRERLITTNMKLVAKFVNQVSTQSMSREDLLQEGAIGLARAVDRWNPASTTKFSTYAYYWIRAAVLRGIAEKDTTIRIPEHVQDAIQKVQKAANALGVRDAWQQYQDARQLAEAAGISRAQLDQAIRAQKTRTLSFESWMQSSGQHVPTVEEEIADDVTGVLSQYLRPKELEALSLRYGLGEDAPQQELLQQGRWGEAMSFREIGKHMKISSEYGRLLCQGALSKLRKAVEDGSLEPDLLWGC